SVAVQGSLADGPNLREAPSSLAQPPVRRPASRPVTKATCVPLPIKRSLKHLRDHPRRDGRRPVWRWRGSGQRPGVAVARGSKWLLVAFGRATRSSPSRRAESEGISRTPEARL